MLADTVYIIKVTSNQLAPENGHRRREANNREEIIQKKFRTIKSNSSKRGFLKYEIFFGCTIT